MAKQKYNFNGTLLNLLLLGGAAVILKKRTGSLRGVGVGAKESYIILEGDLKLRNEISKYFGGYDNKKKLKSKIILTYPSLKEAEINYRVTLENLKYSRYTHNKYAINTYVKNVTWITKDEMRIVITLI